MRTGINLYIEVEIIKKCQKKGIKMSDVAEQAFRDALNTGNSNLKPSTPEKNSSTIWIGFPAKYRKKAINVFMEKHKGLLPNFQKPKHTEELFKIYSKIAKQTKIGK